MLVSALRGLACARRFSTRPVALNAPPKLLPKYKLDVDAAELEHLRLVKVDIVPTQPDLNALEIQDQLVLRQGRIMRQDVRIRKYKPTSPGIRWFRAPVYKHLHKGRPYMPLTTVIHSKGGRNHSGKITVRGRGGGHKRRYRQVDFKRMAMGEQRVLRVEYDPYRTAHIALIQLMVTAKKLYIVAPEGLRAGDYVELFRSGVPQHYIDEMGGELDPALLASKINRRGNCLPILMVPVGLVVHNIGLRNNARGQLCRSAGTYGRILAKIPAMKRAIVRLSLGEHRYVPLEACATLGAVLNAAHHMLQMGKAGRNRWRGRRPKVRGVAMNRVDHPHGGGRGKSKSNKLSQSPWGTLAKGYKTRRGKNQNPMKVKDRPRRLVLNNKH